MTLLENKNATYNNENFIGFWGEIEKQTEKAILVKVECNNLYDGKNISWDDKKDVLFWIPKSAVKDSILHWQGKLTMFLVESWVENKLIEDIVNENGTPRKYAVLPSYYNNLDSFNVR